MTVIGTILVALIVSVIAPYIIAHQMNKQRVKERQLDWERQDIVADRLLTSNLGIDNKLIQIHDLVNSNYTAAIEATLSATRGQLIAMLSGNGDVVNDPSELHIVRAKIAQLESILNERENQAQITKQAELDKSLRLQVQAQVDKRMGS